MSDLIFRSPTEADLPEIRRIAREAWTPIFDGFRRVFGEDLWAAEHPGDVYEGKSDQVESQFRNRPECFFVAELDGKLVGFCTYRLSDTVLREIGNNAVDPGCQGHGVGTAMHAESLRRMREAGMKFAKVTTGQDEGHAAARRAYEKLGFKPLRIQVNYFMDL